MEKMIQIAESYGWAVDMDSDSIEFNQCSPAGEDFSFTVQTHLTPRVLQPKSVLTRTASIPRNTSRCWSMRRAA